MFGSGLVGMGFFPVGLACAPRRDRLCKGCYRNRALARQFVAMPFDVVNFVQGLRRQVTGPTVGAAHHRDVLNDE
jgi:hypothetical protein